MTPAPTVANLLMLLLLLRASLPGSDAFAVHGDVGIMKRERKENRHEAQSCDLSFV